MKKEFVGIDVSKLTLDVHLHHQRIYCRFSNDHEGFVQLFKWLSDHADKQLNNLFFCLEHTGIYSELLVVYLQEQGQSYAIVSGLEVKRSMGLKRGKSDKTDAQALAKYAYQNQDELRTGMPISKNIKELKELLSLRLRFVREMAGHKAYLREQKNVLKKTTDSFCFSVVSDIILVLKKKVKQVEIQINTIMKEDQELSNVYNNLITIKGVGPVLAWTTIAITNNFKAFKNWRKLACYAGIVPFEHSSGTSYRGRTRVSYLGNAYLKGLLTQAAASATMYNAEMKTYYQRKVSEGKSKMSAMNIIRNKLVSRMFAVALRGTPYVDIHKFAA